MNDWMERAACRGMDTAVFYPDRGENAREAKAVCARCEVIDRCAVHALATREEFGVWGGMAPKERGATGRVRSVVESAACPHGHAWTEANTYVDPNGSRRCRTCRNLSKRDFRDRRKQQGRRAS